MLCLIYKREPYFFLSVIHFCDHKYSLFRFFSLAAHKHWEGKCCKAFADFETASYILLERVSSQISSEVFGLLTTQQIGNSKERYNAVWNLIFKHYGPHNQSHIRNQLTKCDPYTEGWVRRSKLFMNNTFY